MPARSQSRTAKCDTGFAGLYVAIKLDERATDLDLGITQNFSRGLLGMLASPAERPVAPWAPAEALNATADRRYSNHAAAHVLLARAGNRRMETESPRRSDASRGGR